MLNLLVQIRPFPPPLTCAIIVKSETGPEISQSLDLDRLNNVRIASDSLSRYHGGKSRCHDLHFEGIHRSAKGLARMDMAVGGG